MSDPRTLHEIVHQGMILGEDNVSRTVVIPTCADERGRVCARFECS